jgi:DNA repair protein RecN (Recombination protein N)
MLQRQRDLSSLKRKYKKDIPGLIALKDELEEKLQQQNSIDEDIASKEKEVEAAHAALLEKAKALTQVRRRIASSIEKELSKSLEDLLLKARFEIIFLNHEAEYMTEEGMDEVDFLIETNIGEGLKPLAKIVSGGEASRIMLAMKSIFVKANKVSTVIFDEIDTGISGEAAQAVANKIREISFARQVIAITHLPQVASMSDHHILIEKEVRSGRTYVSIQELSLDEKIQEVAHLISGGKVTESQLAYAKEMVLSKPIN